MGRIKFNQNQKEGPTIVLIGKRNTGKSFLVRDILYHHRDIPVGTVISGTEEVNPFYSKMMPKLFIHYEYSTYFIENVFNRQKAICGRHDMETARFGRSQVDPRTFVILDDCLHDANTWKRDKLIKAIFMNGRHSKIMLMITMQYPLGIGPELRCNIDYVFLLRTAVVNERRKLYEYYAGMFPSFEAFCQIMDSCTDNYECLVIDNSVQSNKLEDMVFWYKADSHPDFKIGSREFWEMSKRLTDDDVSAEQALTTTRMRANTQRINVHKLG
jgi:hypothetical protein